MRNSTIREIHPFGFLLLMFRAALILSFFGAHSSTALGDDTYIHWRYGLGTTPRCGVPDQRYWPPGRGGPDPVQVCQGIVAAPPAIRPLFDLTCTYASSQGPMTPAGAVPNSGYLCLVTATTIPTPFQLYLLHLDIKTCATGAEFDHFYSRCCLKGWGSTAVGCVPVNPATNLGKCTSCPSPARGNPINVSVGNKFEAETDYTGTGVYPLQFVRYYNSLATVTSNLSVGIGWTHNFARRIDMFGNPIEVYAESLRPDGRKIRFYRSGNLWAPLNNVTEQLQAILDAGGNRTGWTLVMPDTDEVETYDASGNLISIANRAGVLQTLAYSDATTPTTVAPHAGMLIGVADNFGRQLNFIYDSIGRITTMTDPAGSVYRYGYSTPVYDGVTVNSVPANVLVSVTYPDNKIRTYVYNELANTSNTQLLTALTGIVDENGSRFATYKYDAQQRAIDSSHAGGANHVAVQYNANGTATVTDGQGNVVNYNFNVAFGVNNIASASGPGDGVGGTSNTLRDANGFPTSQTDWNGNRTNYVYDTRGLENSRTEGLTSSGGTTPQTRTIATTWHPTFRLPTLITEPGRTTAMSYDTSGNLLTRTITDTVLNTSRTWTYTYNANGQMLTMDGPRTDVNDVTTYTYYDNNDPDHGKAGNLATTTNALGQTTQITAYNTHGQPLTIVDPNGLETDLTYDPRMRLTSRTVGGETTGYTYDGVGQLTKVTLPDGSFLAYTYDAAHRLTQIADSLGNTIVYTLDAMGNRIQEQVFDPTNALAQTRSRVYSSLNRLSQEIGALGQTTTYAYDNQGNVTSIDGPLPGTVDVTTNSYDALNRLTRMTDPNTGQVNYGYNALDQMTSVQDPRNLTTSYGYDALNNLNQRTSPDTGATQNTYDSAGNLLTQIDAKGQTTSYTYDALNRVASISYATDPTLNVAFTYDQGTYGVGRLTGIADISGTIAYAYEIHGRLATETRVISNVTYTTSYSYDNAGRLASITYPGGREIAYSRDALGRINGITTTKSNVTQTLVTTVSYRPFGPEETFTFGNSQTYVRGFDQDGRIAAYTLPNQTLAVGYDNASRITSLTDVATPSNVLNFNYDLLDRLTNFVAPSFTQSFGYDAVGNRTSQTIGPNSYTNSYAGASNRITASSGPTPKSYTFDANGSIVADTVNQYAFDARGRLNQATTAAGVSQYLINTLGQRVKKSAGGTDSVFHYDSGGRLISETDLQGNVLKEYVYLNDIPLAVLK